MGIVLGKEDRNGKISIDLKRSFILLDTGGLLQKTKPKMHPEGHDTHQRCTLYLQMAMDCLQCRMTVFDHGGVNREAVQRIGRLHGKEIL